MHEPPGYHRVTIAASGRLAFIAGQCPIDRWGALVGDRDVEAQVDQVAVNALTALAAAGTRGEAQYLTWFGTTLPYLRTSRSHPDGRRTAFVTQRPAP